MLLRLFFCSFYFRSCRRREKKLKNWNCNDFFYVNVITHLLIDILHSVRWTQTILNDYQQCNRIAWQQNKKFKMISEITTIITKLNIGRNKWIQSQNYISVNFIGCFVVKIILVIKHSSWRSNGFAFDRRYTFHWKCKLCIHCITSNVPYYFSPSNQ